VALAAAAVEGLGIAALPNFLIDSALALGLLVPIMPEYPLPDAGLYVVRPPGAQPSRKLRILTELLIEHFG
jgi:DNA-binding transcriptional LysR family regulator